MNRCPVGLLPGRMARVIGSAASQTEMFLSYYRILEVERHIAKCPVPAFPLIAKPTRNVRFQPFLAAARPDLNDRSAPDSRPLQCSKGRYSVFCPLWVVDQPSSPGSWAGWRMPIADIANARADGGVARNWTFADSYIANVATTSVGEQSRRSMRAFKTYISLPLLIHCPLCTGGLQENPNSES